MKSLYFLFAIFLGVIFPYGHSLTWLIKYNLFIMLFYAFLHIELNRNVLEFSHLKILLSNLFLPLVIFFSLYFIHPSLALAGFITAVTPTGAAAPVLAAFLKIKTEHVTSSVLITSVGIALTIPFLLPRMVDITQEIEVFSVLLPVAVMIFVPLFFGQLVRLRIPKLFIFLSKGNAVPFFLFVINIYIASSKATDFIKNDIAGDLSFVFQIALLSAFICFLNFGWGAFLGAKNYKLESSLGLGRKNTMFAIWLALSFVNPLTALGPMFYIFYQNIYNSYQLFQLDRGLKLEVRRPELEDRS